tara:strand:+ start:6740 stop:7948 length:1209 start_codon:yes stop_codon:yes gene_type:complete
MNKFIYLTAILIFCIGFSACDKSEDFEIEESMNPLPKDISDVRNWYIQSTIKNDHSLLEYSESLDWRNAVVTCSPLQNIVEVSIVTGDRMSLTNTNHPEMNIVSRMLFFGDDNSYYASLSIISSNENSTEFLSNTSNINYGYISEEFNGNISLFNRKFIPLEDNLFVKGKRNSSESRTKNEAVICYEVWELFNDGSKEYVSSFCRNNEGSGSGGYGNGGSDTPSPDDDPLAWDSSNSNAKRLKDCSELNSISKENWFDLTNGDRIAHLMNSLRYEYKNLRNGGYINLDDTFDFGSISGTDNYTPSFAGRIVTGGKVLDITVEFALIGNNTVSVDGTRIPLPLPFNANIKGYHKTGYWAGYRYFTNDNQGGSSIMNIQIKLGESTNNMENAEIFLNAIKECVE